MQGIKQNCVELTAELLPGAERELAAFARVVEEQFGGAQARQSIEDWMAELELMDWQKRDEVPVWRQVTIASTIRLAGRVSAPSLKKTTEFLNLVRVATPLYCDKAV